MSVAAVIIAVVVCLGFAVAAASLIFRRSGRAARALTALVIFLAAFAFTEAVLMPRLDAWNTTRKVEADLDSEPVFAAMKQYYPAEYLQVAAKVKELLAQGKSREDIVLSLTDDVMGLMLNKLSTSSDAAAYTFMQAAANRLIELKEKLGGEACYNFLYPDRSNIGDMMKVYDQKVAFPAAKAMRQAMAQVIESAGKAPQPAPREDAVMPLLQKVVADMTKVYGKDMALLENANVPGVDKNRVCVIVTDLYTRLLALPPEQGGMVMRFLAAHA